MVASKVVLAVALAVTENLEGVASFLPTALTAPTLSDLAYQAATFGWGLYSGLKG